MKCVFGVHPVLNAPEFDRPATTLAYQKSGYQHSDSSVWLRNKSEYTATKVMTYT